MKRSSSANSERSILKQIPEESTYPSSISNLEDKIHVCLNFLFVVVVCCCYSLLLKTSKNWIVNPELESLLWQQPPLFAALEKAKSQ